MGRIVVGVDESTGAAAALRWATDEAAARGWSLSAVMAWGLFDQRHAVAGQPFDPAYGDADAREALAAIVAATLGAGRAATIDHHVVNDLAAPALIEASEAADLLVVGARGLGSFRGLLLGSVSQKCLQHARCPVAIIRDNDPRDQPRGITRFVVGVDGSGASQLAFEWALDAARVHGATVEVVHAWMVPVVGGEGFAAGVFDPELIADVARQTLDAAVEAADISGLSLPLTRTVIAASPAAAILQAAQDADLVVVGSRGLGGFKGLLLGSVSHHLAQHALCPVVVVPPPRA
jgi:nucleotide-binding universal stress UspA family protein